MRQTYIAAAADYACRSSTTSMCAIGGQMENKQNAAKLPTEHGTKRFSDGIDLLMRGFHDSVQRKNFSGDSRLRIYIELS